MYIRVGIVAALLMHASDAADRTHTLQLGADATVADVKSVIEARQGEQCGAALSWSYLQQFAALVQMPAALIITHGGLSGTAEP